MVAAARLRPEIPAEEDDLEQEDGERAALAHAQEAPEVIEDALHDARLTGAVASCITASSSDCPPASSPCTRPSRITRMRCASARISGRSLETTRQAAPSRAFRRMIS